MQTSNRIIYRVLAIIKYFFLTLAILFILAVAGINLPFIQKKITKKANEIFLEKKMPVQVDRIILLIDGRFGLSRIQITKNTVDTVVFAQQIKVSIRILPLLSKKIKVKSITITDATVNLSIDSLSGKLNLLSIFSPDANPVENKDKKKSKWDLGVNSLYLKNIRFSFNDARNGTLIWQKVGKLFVGIDRFSLSDREIYAGSVDLEESAGGIILKHVPHEEETEVKPKADWKFKLKQADLRQILFTLHQPLNKKSMEFTLGKGEISEVAYELAGRNLSAENVNIKEGSFHSFSYKDSKVADSASSFLQIASLNTNIKDLKYNSSESGFTMDGLSLALDNGFALTKGEISFRSDSSSHTKLYSELSTKSSRIKLKLEAADDLPSIISSWQSVPFILNIDDSEISSGDILSFFPRLSENRASKTPKNLVFGLNSSIKGNVGSLNIESFKLRTTEGINLSLSGMVADILKPESAKINIGFLAGPVTPSHIKEILQLTGTATDLPDFEPATMQGRLSGSLTAQEFILNIEGLSGNIASTGSVDLDNKSFTLKMSFIGLELGKLAGIKELDRISGNLDFTGKEFSPYIMSMDGTLTLDSAVFKGYNYNSINAEIHGDNGKFIYEVNSADQFFECNLNGELDLKKSSTSATIGGLFDINAGRLNIYKGISARGDLEADLYLSSGEIKTSVNLKDVTVSNEIKSEDLKNLSLIFVSNDSLVSGDLRADFIKADFRFAGSLDDLGSIFTKNRSKGLYLLDSTVNNRIPFVSVLPVMNLSVESVSDPFTGLILSDTVFSYNMVSLKMVKDNKGITNADLTIDRFKIGTRSGFGTSMHFKNLPDSSFLIIKADSIKSGKISLTALETDLTIENDTLIYRLKSNSSNDSLLYDIEGAAYKSDGKIKLITNNPEWILNGYPWTISPGEFLILEPAEKDFIADLHWKNGEHSIDIYGRKSEKIWLDLNKVWLHMLIIPGMNTFGFDGEFTGKIDYQGSDKTELGIQMDIMQMKSAETMLGNMNINGSFLSDTLGNIESDLKTLINDTSSLDLSIRSGKNSGRKTFRSEFKSIPLNILESLTSKYVSRLEGEVSGKLELKSEADIPRLDGEVKFTKTALTVVPLNARFYLNDDVIKLENNQMLFRSFTIQDSLKKQLSVNGGINFKNTSNVTADLQITSDHLQVMNTSAEDNPGFNGSIVVDSKLTISGPIQKPLISGNIVLAEGTIVNYKLTEDLNVSETEKTITFASLDQDTTETGKATVTIMSGIPDIEASIEINPNSLFRFEISRGYDIGLEITGGGFLNYALLPSKAISLSGTYEISQGRSELKIPGWPRKVFVITPGSLVKWNGPVDDPELNIETTSRVRGSYYNPVDSKNREVNFIVNMKIFNRLSQLEISFDVSSNDQYITSVFSTLSKDERMKQAINLLIFERIELPNMASSSDYVTQQINQFWESQLNQLTKSAIKGVDLSFGIDTYTGASDGGGEQTYTSFTYEVKKEMFNERGSVMVSGRMNDASQAGAPTNNMIENFIFEYALDTGRTRYFKVYRQQNYEDLLEGEVIKSGVGYIYRKSYNRLNEIWRRKKNIVKDSKKNSNNLDDK